MIADNMVFILGSDHEVGLVSPRAMSIQGKLGHMENKLYLVCGKIAAGKSRLCGKLGQETGAVVLSEDAWLGTLFGAEMATVADYGLYSKRLRAVIGPHVVALLQTGVSVVMDFPANTFEQRAWLKELSDQAGVAHELHFLDVAEDVCKERLVQRNAKGEHPFVVTEEQFDLVSGYFRRPSEDEGLVVVVHSGD
jgi:predicted kinase